MEEAARRLSSLSFSQRAEDSLQRVTELLREVKARYARCAAACYAGESVNYEQWVDVRGKCVQPCTKMHDTFFTRFVSEYGPANVLGTQAAAKQCVLRCKPQYVVAFSGEEDLRICEEKCYETLLQRVEHTQSTLEQVYESEFYEKYKPSSSSCHSPTKSGPC